MAKALVMAWMMISVVRRRGVDAAPPKVLRIRGMASPITGTAGRSKSRSASGGVGSTVRIAIGVGAGVSATVGVGVGTSAIVGVGTGV